MSENNRKKGRKNRAIHHLMKQQRGKRPQAQFDQHPDQVSQGHSVNEEGLISLLSDLQFVKPHLTFCAALLGCA